MFNDVVWYSYTLCVNTPIDNVLTDKYNVLTDMLEISVREFQLHASEYLDKLPIVLTVYGKPLAEIIRYDSTEVAPPVGSPKSIPDIPGVKRASDLLMDVGPAPKVLQDPVEIYPCEYMHCKNPSVGKFHIIQYDSAEGVEIDKTLRMCQFHVEMAQGKGDVKEVWK